MIELRDVRHGFWSAGQPLLALDDVSLRVEPGEFVALVGESGCGKSTILRLVAGLLAPWAGQVRVGGELVGGPQPGVGLVLQRSVLLEWRSVLDNVLLPAEIQRLPRAANAAKARALLQTVGLDRFQSHRPRELSGGMQQRVALAQALILDPSMLLLDEPFGALDAITREQLHEELQKLYAARRTTVLFVTHDLAEAVFLADRVLLMTPRPGRIAAAFTVPFSRPRAIEERYSPAFGELCLTIKQAMAGTDAGAPAPAGPPSSPGTRP